MRLVCLLVLTAACSFDTKGQGSTAGNDSDGGAAAGDAAAGDADSGIEGVGFRKTITVPASKIIADLADFPLLIRTDDAELFAAARPDGGDIQFFGTGEQVLDHQLELFADGEMVAWVRIPTLSASTDTVIELRYGDPDASGTDNPTGVWVDFAFVLHLDQTPGLARVGGVLDSSANQFHGTDVNMESDDQVDAIIGQGLTFGGQGARIELERTDLSDTFTFSVWVRPVAGYGSGLETLLANAASGAATDGLRIFYRGDQGGRLRVETGNGSQSNTESGKVADLDDKNWNHVVTVVDRASGNAAIYVDGTAISDGSGVLTDFENDARLFIGTLSSGFSSLEADLDELRVSTVLRPPEWVAASFANVDDGDFVTIGPQRAIE